MGDQIPLTLRYPNTMLGKNKEAVVDSDISWEDLLAIVDALYGIREKEKQIKLFTLPSKRKLTNECELRNYFEVHGDFDLHFFGVEVEPISESFNVEDIIYEEDTMKKKDIECPSKLGGEDNPYHFSDGAYSSEEEVLPELEEVRWETQTKSKEEEKQPVCAYLWKPTAEFEQRIDSLTSDFSHGIDSLSLKLESLTLKIDTMVEKLDTLSLKIESPPLKKGQQRKKPETVPSDIHNVTEYVFERMSTEPERWYTKEWVRGIVKSYHRCRLQSGRWSMPIFFVDKVLTYGLKQGFFIRRGEGLIYVYQRAIRY